LKNAIEMMGRRLQDAVADLRWESTLRSRGYVSRVGDGVAMAVGLESVGFEELVRFDNGSLGMAYDLDERRVGIVVLTEAAKVNEGQGVVGLQRLPDLPVGSALPGRVIDALGNPLDEGLPLPGDQRYPLFQNAPQIIERKPVDEGLWTGVMALDAAIPIGRGQRELIIGDRNTGKTALAIDIVAAQTRGDVTCVYVVIGQPMSRVLTLRDDLQKSGALENTVIVAAHASSTPGMQYLAPYAGAAVAEWFRDQGQHALVIYDDLTKHADAYRELALLLDRPPGREAFPGDIFYVHSELLERAAARKSDVGGGSVTALPLIETTDGDISSYIPTNLISITDGQIYLDSIRFEKNLRPAVDIGRSVSRIGSVAQSPAMRKASKNLRIEISRFESMESLNQVGLELDTAMQESMQRGGLLRQLLRQLRFVRRDVVFQVIALTAIRENWLTGVLPEQASGFVERLVTRIRKELPEVVAAIAEGNLPRDGWQDLVGKQAEALRELRKPNTDQHPDQQPLTGNPGPSTVAVNETTP
jgi:F-type H+-transporting ATPase subunit alpha